MKVILEIPEKNLEILDVLARSQKRSRKALMEYILITHSEDSEKHIDWSKVSGRAKIDWKIKSNIYHQVKYFGVSRKSVADRYNVSTPLINKIVIGVDPAIKQFEKETGIKIKYSKSDVIENDKEFFKWRDENIVYDKIRM
jgi:hypothetical protein